MRSVVALSIALLATMVPGTAAGQAAPPAESQEVAAPAVEEVVVAQLDAFNRQDVDALVANLSSEFAWFAVDSDSTRLELRGRDAFARSMQAYFQSVPSARAEIDSIVATGPFVAVQERALWVDPRSGEELAQTSLAVYEIRDGLIYRVWYYPATR